MWNRLEYRPLEGFVFAVTPFNFTSIAGNLPTAPAIVGNVALWKPASSAVYSAYYLMKLFKEAGLPDGVINFIPGSGAQVGEIMLNDPRLPLISATGSVAMGKQVAPVVAQRLGRCLLELGGNNAIIVTEDADLELAVRAVLFGAIGTAGQRCTSAGNIIVDRRILPLVRDQLVTRARAQATRSPARSDGAIIGSVTLRKTANGPAPSVAAASGTRSSLSL